MPIEYEIYSNDIIFPIAWTVGFLITDILIYGWIIPIAGVYFTGLFLNHVMSLEPYYEILLVICSVSAILLLFLYSHLESVFWRLLFSHSDGFTPVLQIRDFFNIIMVGYYFSLMYYSVEEMIGDQGMKKGNLSEGLGFAVLNPLVRRGLVSERWLSILSCEDIVVGFDPVTSQEKGVSGGYFAKLFNAIYYGTLPEQRIVHQCDLQLIHAAEFIFAIAGFTASIVKLVYFNTLYAYLRAMNILINLPTEESDEDDDGPDMHEANKDEQVLDREHQVQKDNDQRQRLVKNVELRKV